ncbi:MAG TPA: hemolysin III family protein [Pirellulales bacterium]|nr:hemolysin III family protein [Pirellulales bacterium]
MLTTVQSAGSSEVDGGLLPVGPPSRNGSTQFAVTPDLAGSMDTKEIANAMTHAVGLLLSIVAAVVLMHVAAACDFWQRCAVLIYAVTMVAVYAASTASHVFPQPRLRHFFRMLDQGWIYLFIAGTFTPISAAFLRGGSWWVLLGAIWIVALAGFISKVALNHRINNVSTIIPLLLGWMPLLGGRPMLHLVPTEVLWWMLAGGVCYSVGTLFLMYDHRHPYLHAVWHVFVMAGTACHFWAILHYAMPVV